MWTMRNHRNKLALALSDVDSGVRPHEGMFDGFEPTLVCDRNVVEYVAAQIAGDADIRRVNYILSIADAAERGEVKVTWVTGMSKEERRERLFRKMPRS